MLKLMDDDRILTLNFEFNISSEKNYVHLFELI